MRRTPTEFEVRVWRHLSNSQLGHKFRRRHVIFPYICDFFCPSKGLVVEIDGDTHDAPYDERRDARLVAKGFETLRFTNHEVWGNLGGIVLTIASALRARPDRWSGMPHPNPSPEGEGLSAPQSKPLPFRGGVGVGPIPNPEGPTK
ncbi:endonuclease domain-containing protein [Sphingomonas sp. KR3-1]|uniref:endonuclease domain-containing protein n=1 Tax=Sphingomonas sp. KR3-1 TaxID=3156611 RepID=UPI0032B4D9FA